MSLREGSTDQEHICHVVAQSDRQGKTGLDHSLQSTWRKGSKALPHPRNTGAVFSPEQALTPVPQVS